MSDELIPLLTNLASGILGGLIVALTNHYLTKSRDATKSKGDRASAATAWLRGVRELAAALKMEVVRAQIPTDWLASFQTAVIDLRRLESSKPPGVPAEQARQIHSAIGDICSLSDADAMNGAQRVADLLEKLESLTEKP
jgi:hypothetical protein